MKELGNARPASTPGSPVARIRKREAIEVHEQELGTVTAQRLFKMRCECGRSWFELELPQFIKCPACAKLNLVSI
jgi:hypothetical protein